jgi:hypothetical protein
MRTVMALLANEAALSHQSAGLAGLADELDLQLPFVEGAFSLKPISCRKVPQTSVCCSVPTMP